MIAHEWIGAAGNNIWQGGLKACGPLTFNQNPECKKIV